MFELEIKGEMYQFNFGMKFLREANKTLAMPVDNIPDAKKNIGLRYMIASIIDGDIEALIDALYLANSGMSPRLTKTALDAYIDDENTDVDELFDKVKDFLSKANATKKAYQNLLETVEANSANH